MYSAEHHSARRTDRRRSAAFPAPLAPLAPIAPLALLALLALLAGCGHAGEAPIVDRSPPTPTPTPAPDHHPALEKGAAADRRDGRGAASWSASAFLTRHRFSYGVAVQRGGEGPCDGATILVANGHDHTPQYLSQLPTLASCAPDSRAESTSQDALYYADVATGDLDGDGLDEAIVAVLAGPDKLPTSGGLIHIDDDGTERWIDRGIAASSLAIGDLDGDGDLDLAVATYWAPPAAADHEIPEWSGCGSLETSRPGAAPTVGQLLPLGIQGPIFILLQDRGTFSKSLRIPSSSPSQLRLADVDLDGELDLVAAGRTVDVLYGPLAAPSPSRCERIKKNSPGSYSAGVDITHVVAESGERRVLIAASATCSTSGECDRLDRSGVWVWQRPLRRPGAEFSSSGASSSPSSSSSSEPSAWGQRFVEIDGITSALRFADLSLRAHRAGTDLLVGRMTAPECAAQDKLYGHCFGAPLIALRGAWTGDRYSFPERPRALDIVDPRGRTSVRPMAARITPHVGARSLVSRASVDRRCYAGVQADECRCGDCPQADARAVLTYTGSGFVAEVLRVRDDAGPVAFNHSYGERQISLKDGSTGPVEVDWRVVPTPGFLVTSSSPIDLGGPSLFIQPRIDDAPALSDDAVPLVAGRD